MNQGTPNMNLFLYVIVGSAALIFIFRAMLAYPRYKRSIYPHIYDNYLIDYFYKLNVTQNSSRSGLIRKLIGIHRLVFASITSKEGKLVAQIITLIHSKGILSIAHLNTTGKISGSDSGDWYIRRTEDGQEKKFRIDNPAAYLKEYIAHLNQVVGDRKIDAAITLNDDCDISNVKCRYKVIHYSQIEELIKETDCGYGLNDTDIEEIFKKLGGK